MVFPHLLEKSYMDAVIQIRNYVNPSIIKNYVVFLHLFDTKCMNIPHLFSYVCRNMYTRHTSFMMYEG